MSSPYIYTGAWVNWSHGLLFGATLTLNPRSGGLLNSFIAIFVTIVGSQLWRTLCFILHQTRSDGRPHEVIFHQQQAILRNSATPFSAAWNFVLQHRHLSDKLHRPVARTAPWALGSAFYAAVIAVAAIFSSEISKGMGNTRLVRSDYCGYWNYSNAGDPVYDVRSTNNSYNAAAYARSCYGDNGNALACSRYPTKALRWSANSNATCPFHSGLCLYGDTAAISMTTELIDSHFDLGINAPEQDRVQYRKSVVCAPLDFTGRAEVYNGSTAADYGRDGDYIREYKFGSVLSYISVRDNLTTFWHNNHALRCNAGYDVNSYMYIPRINSLKPDQIPWQPVPEMLRDDAQVEIIGIAPNTMRYGSTNSDPIFGANIRIPENETEPLLYYMADRWVGIIGCTEQEQYCNPNNGICTPLGPWKQILDYPGNKVLHQHLNLNEYQHQTVARIFKASLEAAIHTQIETRGTAALRATESAHGILQGPLSNTQWMVETTSWFEISLAQIQQEVMEYATGPAHLTDGAFLTDRDEYGVWMCKNQIINETQGTVSFSILGLVVLFVIGGSVICINQCLELIVGFIQGHFSIGLMKRDRWHADELLSLQRQALLGESQVEMISTTEYKQIQQETSELRETRC